MTNIKPIHSTLPSLSVEPFDPNPLANDKPQFPQTTPLSAGSTLADVLLADYPIPPPPPVSTPAGYATLGRVWVEGHWAWVEGHWRNR